MKQSSIIILVWCCIYFPTSAYSIYMRPRNLTQAINFFEKHWSAGELKAFKTKPENVAAVELHFTVGMWIRNSWIRNYPKSSLVREFNRLGIFNPDDMSSIILLSLHRKLNKKDIKLDEQIVKYKSYWSIIFNCQKKAADLARKNYLKFKKGDEVTIFMQVDTSFDKRNAVVYNCPFVDWTFDTSKDLMIIGRVMNRYFINDSSNAFLSIRIDSMNYLNTKILFQDAKVGGITDFSLRSLRIE